MQQPPPIPSNDEIRSRLSPDLQPVFDFEIAGGNAVAGVAVEAWSRCPYAVTFRDPLRTFAAAGPGLPATLERFENRDPHYPLEEGLISTTSRHAISGPPALQTRA